jgi:hypothetical protein
LRGNTSDLSHFQIQPLVRKTDRLCPPMNRFELSTQQR